MISNQAISDVALAYVTFSTLFVQLETKYKEIMLKHNVTSDENFRKMEPVLAASIYIPPRGKTQCPSRSNRGSKTRKIK